MTEQEIIKRMVDMAAKKISENSPEMEMYWQDVFSEPMQAAFEVVRDLIPVWRPIESAPRDVAILVSGGIYCSDYHRFPNKSAQLVAWQSDMWLIEEEDNYYTYIENPTHWMPLPQPPKAS